MRTTKDQKADQQNSPFLRYLPAKLLKFLAAGVPGIAIAIPLNIFLVKILNVSPPVAYALVLVTQVSLNFLFCRWFVFDTRPGSSIWKQYWSFLSGILLFRILDWALYVFLVESLGWNFLLVQILNVVLFALLKFRYSQAIMEK